MTRLINFKKTTTEITNASTKPVSMFHLTWPIFIELILTMLVGNIDQYMVTSYSENAVGAIGNANQIINLLLITFNIIGTSTTILVSQYIGSKNREKLSIIYTLSILVNLVLSGIIIFVILIFGDRIFTFMKVPGDILSDATTYLKLIGGFIFLQGIIAAFSAIFRSNRMMKETMIISIFVNLVNVVGNAIMIHGFGPIPPMGVAGAAHATNLSRMAGVILYVILFVRKFDTKISLQAIKPFPKVELSKLLGIGIPSSAENFSYSMSMTFILKAINTFGTYVINTKVLASTFAWFSFMYSMAVGQANQVVIGNLMGAGEVEKVNHRVWKTVRNSILVSITISVSMFLFSDVLFGLFSDDPRVLALGKTILFIDIVLQIGKNTNIILVRSLQATGDIKFPMMVGIISMWTIAFGLGCFLAIFCKLGLAGIWIGMALDEDIRAIVFFFRWKKGKWKHNRLASE